MVDPGFAYREGTHRYSRWGEREIRQGIFNFDRQSVFREAPCSRARVKPLLDACECQLHFSGFPFLHGQI